MFTSGFAIEKSNSRYCTIPFYTSQSPHVKFHSSLSLHLNLPLLAFLHSNIFMKNFGATDFDGDYDNQLMRLALDVGERLLPAFSTPTGIPFGTVNLRYGVPEGETEIASTAGAGSLLLELEALSVLSRDNRFGDAAFTAVQALYSRRSYLGLLGKHIHTSNGQWHESSSGIGSNADSFYEYLLKGHLLFHRHSLFAMFDDTYHAVKRHIQVGDWFTEVDMFNGKSRRNRVENLQAFWPGERSWPVQLSSTVAQCFLRCLAGHWISSRRVRSSCVA